MKKKHSVKTTEENGHHGAYGSGMERFLRWLRWIFSRSGVIPLALEHFLAMIPATILVPVLVNNAFDTMVIDMSLVLFTSGVGTIAFIIISKGAIPAYLGSSFAYIGLTIYLVQEQMNGGATHEMAFTYVGWAYLFSGIVLMLLSLMYRKKGIERFLSFLLPATVVGPAISLIGLELADTAIVDSGFDIEEGMIDGNAAIVAIVTLVIIVLFSLIRHRILKNAAIIVGMVIGCAVSFAINGFPKDAFAGVQWFTVPDFHLPVLSIPPNLLGLFLAVLPATFIVFTENIGRITVIGRMTDSAQEYEGQEKTARMDSQEVIDDDTGENEIFTKQSVGKMRTSLFSHGMATFLAGLLGSVPNTIYAENIAVMSIHKTDVKHDDPDPVVKRLVAPYSCVPYLIAAGIAIVFSFVGVLQTLLVGIPKAVIGGMELFLFGIISAPGIQLLVEQRVNYRKVSNQIITAAVLISGISGLSINLGIVELSGMSLGFVVGVVLNLIVQLLKWIGNISDMITFDELIVESLSALSDATKMRILGCKKSGQSEADYIAAGRVSVSASGFAYALSGKDCRVKFGDEWLSDDTIRDDVKHSDLVEVGVADGDVLMRFRRTANGLFVDVKGSMLSKSFKDAYLNDYESIDEDGEWLQINSSEGVPLRRIKTIIRMLDKAVSAPVLGDADQPKA